MYGMIWDELVYQFKTQQDAEQPVPMRGNWPTLRSRDHPLPPYARLVNYYTPIYWRTWLYSTVQYPELLWDCIPSIPAERRMKVAIVKGTG